MYQPATIWRGGWNASDLRKCTLESLYYLLQPNNLHYEAVTHRFAKISPAPEIETTFTPFCSQPEDSVQYDISYMSTFKLCMVALPCHFWTEIYTSIPEAKMTLLKSSWCLSAADEDDLVNWGPAAAHCSVISAFPTLIAHCTLHIANCTLHIANCKWQIVHCTLHIVHYTLQCN